MRFSFCIFIPMMLLTNVNVGSIYNGHIQMILPTLGLEHLLHLLQFLGVSRLLQSCSQSANWVIGTILHLKCKSISPDLVTRCHRMIKSLGGPGYGEPLWYHFYIVNNSVLQPKIILCLVYTKISWESRTLCFQISPTEIAKHIQW